MSEDQPLNADEVKQLLGEGEAYETVEDEATKQFRTATTMDTGSSEIVCPIILFTTDGKEFETNELHSCVYTQVGMYLIVAEEGNAEDAKHVVVPWQQVSHVVLKFDQMEELAKEKGEDTSD